MSSENIKRLFSYRSIDDEEYELQNIDNGIAYFGKISNFNDPVEGMIRKQKLIHGFSPFNDTDVIRAANILYQNVKSNWIIPSWFADGMREALSRSSPWEVFTELNNLIDKVDEYKNTLRVLCTTPTEMHSLMWAHYADSHRGICIEYEVDFSSLPKGLASVPVQYTNELKSYLASSFILSPEDLLSRLLFTKSSEWSYESEWRFVLHNGDESLDLDERFRVVSVTAGYKCSKDTELRALCDKKGLEFYKVRDQGIYGLVRV